MDDLGNNLPGEGEDAPVRRINEPEIIGRASPFAQGDLPDQTIPGEQEYEETPPSEPSPEAEEVERQLAHYAFVREEREREVRLLFRDVPADDVAAAFRAAGASLITLAGERATPVPPAEAPVHGQVESEPRRRRKRKGSKPLGALSLRYFYALGETVYTITITAPSGVVASVAPIFPVAALSEHELGERMAVVFQRPEREQPETYAGD